MKTVEQVQDCAENHLNKPSRSAATALLLQWLLIVEVPCRCTSPACTSEYMLVNELDGKVDGQAGSNGSGGGGLAVVALLGSEAAGKGT